jgi:hypothetical protein
VNRDVKTERRLMIQYANLIYRRKLRVAVKKKDKPGAIDVLHHGTDGYLRDLITARLGARYLRKEIKREGSKPVA